MAGDAAIGEEIRGISEDTIEAAVRELRDEQIEQFEGVSLSERGAVDGSAYMRLHNIKDLLPARELHGVFGARRFLHREDDTGCARRARKEIA